MTMASQKDYVVGTAAALKVLQDGVGKFKSQMPGAEEGVFAAVMARAVVDAVDADRVSLVPVVKTPHPPHISVEVPKKRLYKKSK
jgi:hypothetical protein